MAEHDLQLLSAAQRGDVRAFQQLVSIHEQQVYRFGLRMCGDEEDAKEVLQETLLAAFRTLPGFQGKAALSTWLYQIARSFCIKLRRRRVDEPATMESLDGDVAAELVAADEAPDARAHARQIGRILQAAILALQPTDREAIVLRDVEGLSADEAAEILGIEVGALKSRLHRARLALRERIAQQLGPTELPGIDACPQLAAVLKAATEWKDIDQDACAELERHMDSCGQCTAACESLRKAVATCRSLPGDNVPAHVQTAVRQALQALAGQPSM